MREQAYGCGRTNTTLTLYHVLATGEARLLCRGFESLACGHYPSTFEFGTYGILLCNECADRVGFPAHSKS
jgi:hypothetical protein